MSNIIPVTPNTYVRYNKIYQYLLYTSKQNGNKRETHDTVIQRLLESIPEIEERAIEFDKLTNKFIKEEKKI